MPLNCVLDNVFALQMSYIARRNPYIRLGTYSSLWKNLETWNPAWNNMGTFPKY